jgi:hypothetical protein
VQVQLATAQADRAAAQRAATRQGRAAGRQGGTGTAHPAAASSYAFDAGESCLRALIPARPSSAPPSSVIPASPENEQKLHSYVKAAALMVSRA